MSKFDFSNTISKIQQSYKKDERRANQFGLGNSLETMSENPEDYIVMPEWFKRYYGVMGYPIGKWTQYSGKPDAGKTTACLMAMKAAQDQGFAIVYVETEGKTSERDLLAAGIDPAGVITVNTNITEEVFEGACIALDQIENDYPGAKVLLVIDSYGNTTSMRDSEIKFTEKVGMVGGAAKTNRMGIGAINAKMLTQKISVIIVNYSYANLGSVGETNAGGRALEFACALIISASRVSNYEVTRGGIKVKAGINGRYRTTKNHYIKGLTNPDGTPYMPPKDLNFRITAEGFTVIEKAA
jgi:RecA/RadA recombinase